MSRFASFRAFYPFYLDEHRHPVSRRLHVIGRCFQHPRYSFAGDWVMFRDILRGRIRL